MAQRQFRLDDTSVWADRYGTGADGAGSAGSGVQTTISVASGATSATFGSGTGFADGDLLIIHQSRNGGAGAGAWEFNKIASGGGTTSVTLAYTTTNAYDTTAQVYLMKEYSSYNGTLSPSVEWGGSSGGIAGFFCTGAATITGGSANGHGYRGGSGNNNSNLTGNSGEGTSGASVANSASANGNGGSGGSVGPGGANRAPAGGGNGAAGSGTNPGSTAGNAGLTVAVFGGGGGGKGMDSPSQNDGTDGGGFIVVVAKTITITGATDANGANAQTNAAAGGGGSILLKGQSITLGSGLLTATGGTGGNNAGGTGRIHADYSGTISGTTNPTIDTRVDSALADSGGSAIFAFM